MTLQEIGTAMATQDNRGTQYPLFMVESDIRRYVTYEDDWDGAERTEDYDWEQLCDACKNAEDGQNPNLDFCDNCDPAAFDYFKQERETDDRAGTFFTAKACQEHIDDNMHHYSNPKTYAISAWRNPETVMVMQHLVKLSGQELPGHYR